MFRFLKTNVKLSLAWHTFCIIKYNGESVQSLSNNGESAHIRYDIGSNRRSNVCNSIGKAKLKIRTFKSANLKTQKEKKVNNCFSANFSPNYIFGLIWIYSKNEFSIILLFISFCLQ